MTTVPHFRFEKTIEQITHWLDFVMASCEVGCDKSNHKMYQKALELFCVGSDGAVTIGDELPLDVVLPKKLVDPCCVAGQTP